jgi:hypothetical protein
MPDIHIKVADVERLKSEVTKADKLITDAIRAVDSALRSADWNDANSKAFASQFESAKRKASGFATDAAEMNRFLTRIIEQAKSMGG